MNFEWRDGNRIALLENGEDFFPRVFEAIPEAEREVIIETFILFYDKVGKALPHALGTAAKRGFQLSYGDPYRPHYIRRWFP